MKKVMNTDVRDFISRILYSRDFTQEEKVMMVLQLLYDQDIGVLAAGDLLGILGLINEYPILIIQRVRDRLDKELIPPLDKE